MTRVIYISILFGLLSCGNNDLKKENIKNTNMNDDPSTILRIISTNPSYIPVKEKQEQAKDFLTTLYSINVINSIYLDTIEFVDQGQNFDSIICPFCTKDIDIENWQNAMEKAELSQFTQLTFITPCCSKMTSLNDLRYVTTAGFAKFILTVDDPEKEIESNEIAELQLILNTPLKIIYTHY